VPTGVLITSETEFLIALGPTPTDTSTDLRASLMRGDATAADLRRHFASVYCVGVWQGSDGLAQLSTNPFCEGQAVLARDAGFRWQGPTFDGQRIKVSVQILG
jgi:hypothetical protein